MLELTSLAAKTPNLKKKWKQIGKEEEREKKKKKKVGSLYFLVSNILLFMHSYFSLK